MARMEWTDLLTQDRLGDPTHRQPERGRTEYGRDFDRILFSTPFRRLRDKTQVFPLPVNDHIHNRLTHSIEVASVGRSLGKAVGLDLLQRHPELREKLGLEASDFGDIVAAACLMHDIGNPPFGHSGEDAIRQWFRKQLEEAGTPCGNAPWVSQLSDAQRSDLCHFEGNAQGFRIVSKLSMKPGRGGMQLTHAVLASFMKYPQGSPQMASGQGVARKKFGVYQSELELFAQTAAEVGLLPQVQDSWCRHPLAYLVEAADDICYNVLDAEDGHTLGLIRFEDCRELMAPLMGRPLRDSNLDAHPRETVSLMRALALHNLIEACRNAFLDHEEEVLQGKMAQSLVVATPLGEPLRQLTAHVSKTCYNAVDVLQIQVAGYQVLARFLDLLIPAATGDPSQLRSLDKVMYEFLVREVDGFPGGESAYERILRVTDFVSGMTDRYAMNLYRRFTGVSLPGMQ